MTHYIGEEFLSNHSSRIRYLNFIRKEIVSAERLEKRKAAAKKASEAAAALAAAQAQATGTVEPQAAAEATGTVEPQGAAQAASTAQGTSSGRRVRVILPSVIASGSVARREARKNKEWSGGRS